VTTNNDENDGSSTPPSASQTEHHPYEGKLDFSPSSGAKGAEQKIYDATAPTENDGRSKTVTKFNAEEGFDGRNYERLGKINDGMYSDDLDVRVKRADVRRDIDIFTDRVDFSPLEQKRAHQLLRRIEDIRRFQRDEVLVLSIITMVANENNRRIRENKTFETLRDTCNVKKSEIRAARSKLREKL